jgi:2-methylcitrate dehydratase PrpD
VALALVKQDAGADKYCDETVQDKTIQDLAGKVALVSSPKWEEGLYPHKRGATVTMFSKAGRSCSAEVDLAKGEPENPADWKEIYQKFLTNATSCISQGDAEALAETHEPIGRSLREGPDKADLRDSEDKGLST